MRLKAPCQEFDFHTTDIYGQPFELNHFLGKRVLLSFFRDAACPFCNFRVYELTHQYKSWKNQGLEVIAVFSDTPEKVAAHVAKYPRPFTMLADPDLAIYNQYGVEHSLSALFKALLFRLPTIVRGFISGGRPSMNPHLKLVPADFLINESGMVEDVWYGENTSDHIPLSYIKEFIRSGVTDRLAGKQAKRSNKLINVA